MDLSISEIIGLPGLAADETRKTHITAKVFNTLLIIAGLWLPLQYYLQSIDSIPFIARQVIDWLIWATLLTETITITSLAKHKLRYVFSNWLNLFLIVIAFPLFWSLGVGSFNILNYLRVLLLFRLFYPAYPILKELLARNSLSITLMIVLLVTFLGGLGIALIDPGFNTPFKGIWFAAQTVSTVGYGDVIPNTLAGKVFALVLMFIGVGFFSVLSGNLAAHLIAQKKPKLNPFQESLLEDLKMLHQKVEKLRQEVSSLRNDNKREL